MHEEEPEVELAELLDEVRRIEAQSKRLVTGQMAGGYSSVFRGSGIEVHEIREYVEGDDPRSVDWSVTARVGRPFVKEYVEERQLTMMFLFDLSASMGGGFGVISARRMAARVCACLALSAINNDDRVGLIAFSGDVDRFVPARKGVRHVLRIVRDCLALRGSGVHTSMVPALEFASRAVRRHAVVFLVSDFLEPPARWKRALTLCANRHDLIAVRLSMPELDPPDAGAGLARLRDPESGRESVVDWSDPRVRGAYVRRVTAARAETERALRRAGVDLMDVPVPRILDKDAVARPILEFFRMREERGAKR